MTYRAKMENGKVVFEGGIKPADGVELRVDVVPAASSEKPSANVRPTVAEVMKEFSGCMRGADLPKDGAQNHDHYIYGSPKR
jgi:hypothetical protein